MAKIKSLLIDEQLDVELSGRATLAGVKFSELMRRAAELYLDMDEFLIKAVGRFAVALRIRPGQVVAALAIQQLAAIDAETEVYGISDKAFAGFVWHDGQLADGEKLYKQLKQSCIHSLNLEKEAELLKREKFGVKISPDDQKFLDARKKEIPNIKREKIQIGSKTVFIREDGKTATYSGDLTPDEETELAEALRIRRANTDKE